MSEYKFSWPARYVRVHRRRNHIISKLTSGLSEVLKPASTALFSISESLNTAAANLTTGSVDSWPGMEELGSPGEAKTRSEVSMLTSLDFSRLYRMISAGIKAVSPSVSCDKTFPATSNIQ